MKKKYEKPQLFMESFEVAEFIAGTCELVYGDVDGKPNAQDKTNCWATYGHFTDKVFLTKGICDYIVDKDDPPFPGICYNNPNSASKTWLS